LILWSIIIYIADLGGFYIAVDQLPIVANWIPYLSIFKWGYEALMINEFKGNADSDDDDSEYYDDVNDDCDDDDNDDDNDDDDEGQSIWWRWKWLWDHIDYVVVEYIYWL